MRRLGFIIVTFFALAAGARATFHLTQIEQVIGGVNGDTSAQAVQLRMRSVGQNLVSGARLVAYDAAGSNPVIIIDMTNNVANSVTGDRVLIVSTNFANYSSPVITPDFRMTRTIPISYLTAGRLTFEDDTGPILWSLSWGGTNYTGSNIGEPAHFNDSNGDFGPSFPLPLPTASTQALLFTNTASALSRSNIVDYVITAGSAVFTNNARQVFFVVPAPQVSVITNVDNNVRIVWTAAGGRSYIVQATPGDGSGGFSTNNFTNISATITVPGTGNTTTNFLDGGGATNAPSRYYRVRLVP